VGQHSTRLISIIGEIMYRCNLSTCNTSKIYNDEEERKRYLCALLDGADEEKVYMVMFNRTNRFIDCVQIGEGLYGESEIGVARAIEKATRAQAASVIIAHNHPGGIAAASATDEETAQKLNVIFLNSDIDVIGHYVVAGNKCTRYGEKSNKALTE